jgi:hypothetical protein
MLSRSSERVEGTQVVLTETKTMTVKPGEGITPNVEIQYNICNSMVNPAASIWASGSGTYPNAAIKKTGLNEQSEYPINPDKSTSFT